MTALTTPLPAFEYDQARPTPDAATTAVQTSLVYSVAENFSIEQLEGAECVLCEQPIDPGQNVKPVWMDSHFDLHAHEQCPEDGETP